MISDAGSLILILIICLYYWNQYYSDSDYQYQRPQHQRETRPPHQRRGARPQRQSAAMRRNVVTHLVN